MDPYYQDNSCTLFQGHVLDVLNSMESESVQCVVTSPPYWGLRDYGLPPTIWDGEPDCEHEWGEESILEKCGKPTQAKGIFEGRNLEGIQSGKTIHQGSFCTHCGAWKGSLGLEPTPELYIDHIVQVFREVQRVLRKDGTCWLNLGDSYATSPLGNRGEHATGKIGDGNYKRRWDRQLGHGENKNKIYHKPSDIGLKPKDLCGIPWRVALALQADGWWLRSDIIWAKPNPMPESVTDRPTKSHEYVFLMSKSAKYFWDQEAVKEDGPTYIRKASGYKGFDKTHTGNNQKGGFADKDTITNGRNIRTVWTIATQPYSECHFATFPIKLVEPCVKAGSAIGDTVLDPFSGSGTVLYVAKKLGRYGTGIELNTEYCELTKRRIRQEVFQW